jgi:hypothetical protein
MPTYRLRDDESGEELGVLEHPAPNVDVGDIVLLADNREAIVTARVEGGRGSRVTALLEIVPSPFPPDTTATAR